jgi:hypothetical protein
MVRTQISREYKSSALCGRDDGSGHEEIPAAFRFHCLGAQRPAAVPEGRVHEILSTMLGN